MLMCRGGPRTQLKAWLKDELPEAGDADAQLLGFGGMGALAADLCRGEFAAPDKQAQQGWWQQPAELPAARDRRTHNGRLAARALFPAEALPLRGCGRRGGWPAAIGGRHVSAPEPLQEASSLPTTASMQLDELISELADAGDSLGSVDVAGGHEEPIISAGLSLEPLDLSLPILPDLAPLGSDGLRGLLLEGLVHLPAPVAAGGAPCDMASVGVPGSSEHGSTAAESLLQAGGGSAVLADAGQGAEGGLLPMSSGTRVAQFLSAEGGLVGAAGEGAGAAPKEDFGGQALTLASARSSIMSLASDSTAVGMSSCHSSTVFHSGTPGGSAAPTPEVGWPPFLLWVLTEICSLSSRLA